MSTSPSNDQAILAALRQGREAALDELFRTHYADLCQTAYRLLPDRNLAEDLVQEVFMELWRKRAQLEIQVSFRAYLRRATLNRTLNYLRNRKLDVADESQLPLHLTTRDDDAAAGQMETAELQAEIDRAIAALPERCREVFVLSRFEEMSAKEIAETLQISPKTVENQMTKALRHLREWLKPFWLWWIMAWIG